jgi:Rad3-related DNA helicase
MRVLQPARILKTLIGSVPTVFTSGTLAIEGRLDSFVNSIGASTVSPLSAVIEPRKHGLLQFVLADRRVRVDTDEWLDYVAAGIKQACSGGGNVLVLTTSFLATRGLSERVAGSVAQRQGEALSAALQRFSGGVFISPAAWEGLDLPHQWTDVVIPRVPYPRPDEVIDIHFLTAQDQAIRRLAQGMARGLRRIESGCTVWILDSRFPLPAEIVNSGLATQQAAARQLRLVAAIPPRFRTGLGATFRKAEIFRVET